MLREAYSCVTALTEAGSQAVSSFWEGMVGPGDGTR